MRYAQIRDKDISDTDMGIAVALYVQGCHHHCKGCFNEETWDFNGGKEWTEDVERQFIELCKDPVIDNISILGGEPLQQGDTLYWVLKRLKQEVDKPIYLWTGYTWEQVPDHDVAWDIVRECVDVLIEGKFELDKRDISLPLRGSSNQRVIDVKKSLQEDKIVEIY